MKKLLKKTLTILVLIAYLFTLVPVNLLAATNDNYNDGDIINPVKQSGSLNDDGDVLLTKTISKTDTSDEYLVTLDAKGKNTSSTHSEAAKLYVAIAFDVSVSMNDTDTKFQNAKNGVISFMNQMKTKYPSIEFALVTYSGMLTNISGNKYGAKVISGFTSSDLSSTVNSLKTDGSCTKMGDGIYEAKELLINKRNANTSQGLYTGAKYIMLVVGDGSPNGGGRDEDDEADSAKQAGIEIYSLGYEVDSFGEKELKEIASEPSSTHYKTADESSISSILSGFVTTITVVSPAGTNAKITDTIADGFSYVEGSASHDALVEGQKVSFDIKDITEEGKTVSFKIKLNDNMKPGIYVTNNTSDEGVKVEYDTPDGKKDEKIIESSSEVYVNPNFNYTINYYLENTNNNPIDTKNGTGKYNDTVKIDVPEKDGYEYNGEKSFIIDEDNKVINVIYEKSFYSYTVKYYKDEIKEENDLNDDKTGTEKYETVITIDLTNIPHGYEFNGDNTFTLIKNNQLEKVLYTKISGLDYVINYYKDGISENNFLGNVSDKATYDDEIDVDITKFIPTGYEFTESKPTLKIDTENNIINVIYTKKTYTYKVKYVDEDGNVIKKETKSVKYNTEVTEESLDEKDIPEGYELNGDEKQTKVIDKENIEITFNYQRKTYSYEVRYVDENGEELAPSKNETIKYNENANEEAIEIDNYVLDESTENNGDVNIIEDGQVITYIYNKQEITYTINYLVDGKIVDTKEINLPFDEQLTEDLISDENYNNYDFDRIEYLDRNIINVYYNTKKPEYVVPPKTGVDYLSFVLLVNTCLVGLFLTKKKLG